MLSDTKYVLAIGVFSNILAFVNVQIAMPMYMPAAVPQPVYAVPPPMPILAIELPKRRATTTTTTTTTTPEPPRYALAMPVPVQMPMPMQVAIPAQPPPVFCQSKPRPKACPPCPPCVCLPSCTPAFFSYCSPCHQACRCRNPQDAPVPLPPAPVPLPAPVYPAPLPVIPAPVGPPPIMVVPLPPVIRRPNIKSDSSGCDSDSSDSSNDLIYVKRGRKIHRIIKRRKRKFRRNAGEESDGNNNLVKPVLSYVSENGDVKFETKLSDKEAIKILNNGIIKTSDDNLGSREADEDSMVVRNGRRNSERKYSEVLLRDGPSMHQLKKGKSRFILTPPANKKIDKVAIAFQVT